MSKQYTEKEKMISGEPYLSNDPELTRERKRAKVLCFRYNQEVENLNTGLLADLLGYASNAYLEPPFHCDYGYNIRLGENFYANHNLVILDCAPVTIGDNVFIAPNVVISTATHPVDALLRSSGIESARPIRIGNNVWIGANASILPGVEIGDNVTIGAGSVVTKSIPSDCVAVGNPCRVLRSLTQPQAL